MSQHNDIITITSDGRIGLSNGVGDKYYSAAYVQKLLDHDLRVTVMAALRSNIEIHYVQPMDGKAVEDYTKIFLDEVDKIILKVKSQVKL